MEQSPERHSDVIYVLRLEHGKFYVGRTSCIEARLGQHSRGEACYWTSLHAYLDVVEKRPVTAMFQEDAVVKEYMVKYGIDNVRGGSYSQEILSKQQKETLQQEFRTQKDACFRCGKTGHYASGCSAKYSLYSRRQTERGTGIVVCNRCGREGHSSTQCFASFHADGGPIHDYDDCHGDAPDENVFTDDVCWRCGRPGHWAADCFAKRHISGHPI
jgi:predicted GIY-YIG superfamily endonuclease